MTRAAIILIAWLSIASCGDDDATSARDAGTTGDAGDDDASMRELEWPELSVGQTVDPDDPTRIGDDAVPADLSCLGSFDVPEPGAPTAIDLQFELFNGGAGDPAPNVCFRAYLRGDPSGDAAPCASDDPRSDATGAATIEVLGDGPFSLRVFATEGTTSTDSIVSQLLPDLRPSRVPIPLVPDEEFVRVLLVSPGGLALLPLTVGHERVEATALAGISVRDCAANAVYGARLRLARLDGTYLEPGPDRPDFAQAYFSAVFAPDPDQSWTHVLGAFGAMNIRAEPGGERLLAEVWGRPAGEPEPRVIGCRSFLVEPDHFTTVVHLDPLGPADPDCPGIAP